MLAIHQKGISLYMTGILNIMEPLSLRVLMLGEDLTSGKWEQLKLVSTSRLLTFSGGSKSQVGL